jgi:hypothetical protein
MKLILKIFVITLTVAFITNSQAQISTNDSSVGSLAEQAARLNRNKVDLENLKFVLIKDFPPSEALELSVGDPPKLTPTAGDPKNATLTVNVKLKWSQRFYENAIKLDYNSKSQLLNCYVRSLFTASYKLGSENLLLESDNDIFESINQEKIPFKRNQGEVFSAILLKNLSGDAPSLKDINISEFTLRSKAVPLSGSPDVGDVIFRLLPGLSNTHLDLCKSWYTEPANRVVKNKELMRVDMSLSKNMIKDQNSKSLAFVKSTQDLIIPYTHKMEIIQVVGQPELLRTEGEKSIIQLQLTFFANIKNLDKFTEIFSEFRINPDIRTKMQPDDVCFGFEVCFSELHPDVQQLLAIHCNNMSGNSSIVRYWVSLVRKDGSKLLVEPFRILGGGEMSAASHGISCQNSSRNGIEFAFWKDRKNWGKWTQDYVVPTAELGNLGKFLVTGIEAFTER